MAQCVCAEGEAIPVSPVVYYGNFNGAQYLWFHDDARVLCSVGDPS
jgi:hypothetical protein